MNIYIIPLPTKLFPSHHYIYMVYGERKHICIAADSRIPVMAGEGMYGHQIWQCLENELLGMAPSDSWSKIGLVPIWNG